MFLVKLLSGQMYRRFEKSIITKARKAGVAGTMYQFILFHTNYHWSLIPYRKKYKPYCPDISTEVEQASMTAQCDIRPQPT